jgi:hypothetical protein
MKNYLLIFVFLFATNICKSQEKKVDSNKKINSDLKIEISNTFLINQNSEKEPESNLKIVLKKKDEEKTSEVLQIENSLPVDSNLKKTL